MNIVKQFSVGREGRYDFHLENGPNWQISYEELDYPSKLDEGQEDFKKVLRMQEFCQGIKDPKKERSFTEMISQYINGEMDFYLQAVGHSFVFSDFNHLIEKTKDEIFNSLSLEARTFLEKGLKEGINRGLIV